jgi:branched-chain amino acid transport system permease protein
MFYAWAFRNPTFNGADGLGGIPRLDLSAVGLDLDNPAAFATTTIVLCAFIWLVLEIVVRAPYGRTLAAIRQNSNRVAALGGRVFLYRWTAFVGSGALAAFAGGLLAQHANFISPDLGKWFVSGDVLIAVIIGGIGTLVGPILGAAVLILLKEVLSSAVGYWYLCLGLVFIGVALYMPNGIIGELQLLQERLARRRGDRAVRPAGDS